MARTYRAPVGATNEYHKAVQARLARKDAKARAQLEEEQLNFTTEGDFSHLSRTTMRFKRR